jgi:exopolysaccharide production protein ExoY
MPPQLQSTDSRTTGNVDAAISPGDRHTAISGTIRRIRGRVFQASGPVFKLSRAVSVAAAIGNHEDAQCPPPVGGTAKRFIDIVVASCALIFFLPLIGLIAGLVKLSDGGPVFYGHLRIGHGWRSFRCFKFRTMVVNADEVLKRHLATSPEADREWAAARKLKRDPRITAVGSVLRKLSIDELPQLVNVLRGDMSIVGPRPIVSDEIGMYGPHAGFYVSARPGLTGPWQVSGRNDKSYDDRVTLDCAYVQNWSLRADIAIIVRTIPAVLSARGTY